MALLKAYDQGAANRQSASRRSPQRANVSSLLLTWSLHGLAFASIPGVTFAFILLVTLSLSGRSNALDRRTKSYFNGFPFCHQNYDGRASVACAHRIHAQLLGVHELDVHAM